MVRISAYVIAFVTKCRARADRKKGVIRGWCGKLLAEASIWFSAFPVTTMISKVDSFKMKIRVHMDKEAEEKKEVCLVQMFADGLGYEEFDKYYQAHQSDQHPLTDRHLNAALLYYFRVASQEVMEFNSQQVVERRTVLKDGVLLSKGRILPLHSCQAQRDGNLPQVQPGACAHSTGDVLVQGVK